MKLRITAFVAALVGMALGTAIYRVLPDTEVHAQAAIVVSTQGDVTLTGAGTPIAIGSGTSRWVDVIALTTNSAAVRCGNSTVSSTRGVPIAAGGAYRFPASPNQNLYYDLSSLYCAGANGDKFALVRGAN